MYIMSSQQRYDWSAKSVVVTHVCNALRVSYVCRYWLARKGRARVVIERLKSGGYVTTQ